jgi:CelD/BcsL family acetyltransferase involved in cellulose biosynthesis
VVEREDAFSALKVSWDALLSRVPGAALCQSFTWCHLTWLHFPAKTSERLRCVTVWDAERLIAVWPCLERRVMGVRHLVQLGFGIGDYSRPLIDPDGDRLEICQALLRALTQGIDAFDIVCLDFSATMMTAVSSVAGLRRVLTFTDYAIDPHTYGSWHGYMSSFSKNMRNHLQSTRRKLEEAGTVKFSIARTPKSRARVIDWTLARKQEWLGRHELVKDWYASSEANAFLNAVAAGHAFDDHLVLFQLELDGVLLASWFGALDEGRVGGFMITFDINYQKYSPGMLLIHEVAHWAYACNRIAELGGQDADYKDRWANVRIERSTYFYGLSLRGAIFQSALAGREVLAKKLKTILPSFLVRVLRKRSRSEVAIPSSARSD